MQIDDSDMDNGDLLQLRDALNDAIDAMCFAGTNEATINIISSLLIDTKIIWAERLRRDERNLSKKAAHAHPNALDRMQSADRSMRAAVKSPSVMHVDDMLRDLERDRANIVPRASDKKRF